MGKVCRGGIADGMPVYTGEDRRFCEEGGGHVVDDGGGGCSAGLMAAMPAQGADGQSLPGGLAPFAVSSFRRLRKLMGEHPVVKELLTLNREAASEVERCALSDECFRKDLVSALALLAHLAEAVTARGGSAEVYTQETHERLKSIAHKLRDRTENVSLQQAIDRVVRLADPLVGKSAADIGALLKGNSEGSPAQAYSQAVRPITRAFPSSTVVAAGRHATLALSFADARYYGDYASVFEEFVEASEADRAIEAKAASLVVLAGSPLGDSVPVPGGYMRPYQGCDIYYSKADGAHEVHGDIRAKYNALGGAAGVLGLPVTDETATPDGIGRYNHFNKGGSIYWTPTTGPMVVRGVIRNLWAKQGWERGPMGYPVADEYRLPPLFFPRDNPDVTWSLFQNGALFSKGNAAGTAFAADISPDALKSLIRTFFDRGLKQNSEDLGLEAQVDLLAVSGWSYGFWAASPRTITYRLYGFHDNGWLPDTTFEIEIRLRFTLASAPMFTYPTFMSLIASLDWLRVHASGLGSGTASSAIFNGINQTFYRGRPDPGHPEVPDGAIFIASFPTGVDQTATGSIDVIDVQTTAQGGLQILVNPLPPSIGGLRRNFAQNLVDAFLQNF